MDLPVLYLILKFLAVSASFLAAYDVKDDMVPVIISVLSFACVFLFELLAARLWKKKSIIMITIAASMAACFIMGIEKLVPLFAVLMLHLFELVLASKMYWQVGLVALVLLYAIFPPGIDATVLSAILIVMHMAARHAVIKQDDAIRRNEALQERIVKLEEKVADLNGLMKTLKATASLEERNRIAARIHDEIGHGISGTIILLEAALLQLKDNRDKAAASVEKAIANLRESVDEIRTALREERADRALLGIQDVTSILEEFKVKYNISTKLKTSGDLSGISLDMWACIHDNLKECLTNVLKHSNATEFVLDIKVFNKIVKVEYKDNGKTKHEFEKHLGLEAIEERTVSCKGRCFINKDENGFAVTNIFTLV